MLIIKIPSHTLAIPFVIQMTFLDWNADDVRPECRDALAAFVAHAGINETIAAVVAAIGAERTAMCVGIPTKDRGFGPFIQCVDVVNKMLNRADQHAHRFTSR